MHVIITKALKHYIDTTWNEFLNNKNGWYVLEMIAIFCPKIRMPGLARVFMTKIIINFESIIIKLYDIDIFFDKFLFFGQKYKLKDRLTF